MSNDATYDALFQAQRIDELTRKCAELRAELAAEKEARSNDQKYYQEAVAAANEGRPLGPVIGAQTIINQQEEIKRLRAENAALRKDAERYRWLRTWGSRWEVRRWTGTWWDSLTGDGLDEAIDTERKGEVKE